jgi:antitoxin component HigA of HigAB toxin-antitoxin module
MVRNAEFTKVQYDLVGKLQAWSDHFEEKERVGKDIKSSGAKVIAIFLERLELSQKDLGVLIGASSTQMSDVINGRQRLSKNMIEELLKLQAKNAESFMPVRPKRRKA